MQCYLKTWNKKGRDLTQSSDKNPFTNINSKKQNDNAKRHQNFDKITITD